MSTVKIIQRTNKIRRNGTAPLYIRLTHRRRSRYVSLKVNLLPEHWDQDRQRVKKAHPFSTRLNSLISHKRAEYDQLAIEISESKGELAGNRLRQLLEGPAGTSFLDRAFTFVNDLIAQGRHGTARNYRNTFNQLRDWLKTHRGNPDLNFASFSTGVATEFKRYLEQTLGNHPNTIKVKFAALRRVMNQAQREGIIQPTQNILRAISTPSRKREKRIPNPEQMQAIERVAINPGSRLWHTRNLFLFSARMAGMHFADVLKLRWNMIQGKHLVWTTTKTNKPMRLLMPDCAREILEVYRSNTASPTDYIFPFLQEFQGLEPGQHHRRIGVINTHCNRDLSRICKLAGLHERFSFHSARHFFATQALRKGMRVELLKEIMSHSSIKQTLQYVRIVGDDLDQAMRALDANNTETA
ncbi:MAG: site-specific integrase [Bacteroidota bacterium]